MPKLLKLGLANERLLRALRDHTGGTTAAGLGGKAGLSGHASTSVLKELVEMGLANCQEIDVDGIKETIWVAARAGDVCKDGGNSVLPDVKARRDGNLGARPSTLMPCFGSNRLLASRVGELLGGLHWVGVAFAGGMSELPWIAARTVVVNDLHGGAINLAKVAADGRLGPQMYRNLRRMPLHQDLLAEANAVCAEMESADAENDGIPNLRWAVSCFYAAWAGRNGLALTKEEYKSKLSTRWDAGGGDSAVRLARATGSLLTWRKILSRMTFVRMDALEFIAKVKDRKGHGVYCDPPFDGNPGTAYKYQLPDVARRRMAEALGSFCNARAVVRSYRTKLTGELFPRSEWEWVETVGRKQTNQTGPEVLLVKNGL